MPEEAGALKCPHCGGPAAAEQTRCTFCNVQLATTGCPGCFAKIFVGYEFCPHCGASVSSEKLGPTGLLCPRCQVELNAIKLGGIRVSECGRCGGLWVKHDSFDRVVSNKDEHASVLGMVSHAPGGPAPQSAAEVRYIPCPSCKNLMNRVNFAHISGVIIDTCKNDGVWFDRDELRQIVEFIETGGLAKSRQRELERLEEERRALKTEAMFNAIPTTMEAGRYGGTLGASGGTHGVTILDVLTAVGSIIGSFFR